MFIALGLGTVVICCMIGLCMICCVGVPIALVFCFMITPTPEKRAAKFGSKNLEEALELLLGAEENAINKESWKRILKEKISSKSSDFFNDNKDLFDIQFDSIKLLKEIGSGG